MKKVIVMYPSDFFNISKIDDNYKLEFNILKEYTDLDYMFFNYDEFLCSGKLKTYPNNIENALVLYRGWMLKSEKYNELFNLLKEKKLILINNSEEYENCHEFPLSYEIIKDYTPKILSYKLGESINWDFVKNYLKEFMVKDYVKSIKDNDFPKYFDNGYTNDNLDKYIEKFISIRDTLFVKGIVLKEYISLKKYNNKTNEYRCFFLNGKLLINYKNSEQSEDCSILPFQFISDIPKLKSNFYTIDFAELEDGRWMIIETGDGQVSGLPLSEIVIEFYKNLEMFIKEKD